jgi:hypothetical protein
VKACRIKCWFAVIVIALTIITAGVCVIQKNHQIADLRRQLADINTKPHDAFVANVIRAVGVTNVEASNAVTNSNPALPDQNKSNRSIVKAIRQADFSLVVEIDHQTGAYALLAPDRKIVSLIDGDGSVAWTKDMVEAVEKAGRPGFYRGKIDGMYSYFGGLVLEVGNGWYEIDRKNGSITNGGSR